MLHASRSIQSFWVERKKKNRLLSNELLIICQTEWSSKNEFEMWLSLIANCQI